jgi:CDP-diglyceride synthetase
MIDDRLRLGSLVSAVGAALLAVSVFLPWYGVTLTAGGVASAQQALNNVAQQYGNATFQTQAKAIGLGFSAFTGHQVTTLSAHQALKYLNVILLILAGIAFLVTLLRLAGASESSQTGGGQVALVGLLATICVLFRMVDRPAPLEQVFSLSLAWGIWLALVGSAAIVIGSLWSTLRGSQNPSASSLATAWDGLSGWTPDA